MKQILFIPYLFSLFAVIQACSNQTDYQTVKKMERTSKTADANTLSPEEIAEGWQLLFDGQSLSLWKGYNMDGLPKEGWFIRRGELVGKGGAALITKAKFENFEFKLDFQLTKAANSGIFYFVNEVLGEPIYRQAPEYQLIDNETYLNTQGAEIMHKHLTGDAFNLYDGLINPGIGHGKWYQAKIRVKDGQVQHWLNEKLCIEYDIHSKEWQSIVADSNFDETVFAKPAIGHIGLQYWASEVKFRNLKIRNL